MSGRTRGWLQRTVREAVREAVRDELTPHEATMTHVVAEAAAESERLAEAREAQLARVLEHAAAAIDAMVSALETQTQELSVYLARTELLARELVLSSLPADAPPSTVRGGSIEPATARWVAAPSIERELDLRDELVPGARVEVRSHFQGRWISGFRLLEVLETDEGTRYRVERRFDHSALPVLFGATEIRAAIELAERDDIAPDSNPTRH